MTFVHARPNILQKMDPTTPPSSKKQRHSNNKSTSENGENVNQKSDEATTRPSKSILSKTNKVHPNSSSNPKGSPNKSLSPRTRPAIITSQSVSKTSTLVTENSSATSIITTAPPSATTSASATSPGIRKNTGRKPKAISFKKTKSPVAKSINTTDKDIAKVSDIGLIRQSLLHPPKHEKHNVVLPGYTPAFRSLAYSHKGHRLTEILHVEALTVKTSSSSSPNSEEGFMHILQGLYCLENQQHVFLQRILDYQDIEGVGATFRERNPVDLAYQLMNKRGQLMFLMEQHKLFCSSFIFCTTKSFENTLYDLSGNRILRFIGPAVFMSKMISRMNVTDSHGRLMGYIKAFGSKVNYSVYNAIGERLYLVTSGSCLPSNRTVFNILAQGKTIGVIRNRWHIEFPGLDFIDSQDAGIEFPPEIDDREKALLMGAMMLIEYTWLSPLTKLKLFFVFVGIFLTSFTLILAFTPFLFDNQKPANDTKSYFTAKDDDSGILDDLGQLHVNAF